MSKLDSIINVYEDFCLKTLRDSYDLSSEINKNIGFTCDKCGCSQNFHIGNILQAGHIYAQNVLLGMKHV